MGKKFMELISVPMRCARTGGAFSVLFYRGDPAAKLRVQSVVARDAGTPSSDTDDEPPVVADLKHLLPQLDWIGWYCPHCQANKDFAAARTHCGRCEELTCGSTRVTIGSRTHFLCHKACGASGYVQSARGLSYPLTMVKSTDGPPAQDLADEAPTVALRPPTRDLIIR